MKSYCQPLSGCQLASFFYPDFPNERRNHMQRQSVYPQSTDKKTVKIIIVAFLYLVSILILGSGLGYSIYSLLADTSFTVFGASVHGFVFGLLVFYLGLRYFLSVRKLKNELYKSSSVFSWKNFSKHK